MQQTQSNVFIIPARKRVGNNTKKEETPKLKVAAYCRVSTDSDEQATSYEVQVDHYTKLIQNNSAWEFAGIYADDGISGTNTKKREEFNRMIDECMAGRIDMVITKSISRFARNTLDCLKYVRMLRDKNVPIFFEKENINTMDSKGEVLLTIMASMAQQESESLSKNVKLGLQFRYQNGQVQVNHKRFMGYTKDADGKLIVDPKEAVIVRRIFKEYLEGKTLSQISRGLEADQILTGAGGKKWYPETVKGMLINEKYMGDALLQKTYTTDFMEKTRVRNDGIVPQYYVKDCHEAIIPKDLFMLVQEEIARRDNMQSGPHHRKRAYKNKYALSSMVVCSKCGDIYRRLAWNNRGKRSNVWRCCTRVEHGPKACDAATIREEDLQMVTVRAINMALRCSPSMLQILEENIASVLTEETDHNLATVSKELEEKQRQIIAAARSDQDYDDSVLAEIEHLKMQKQRLFAEKADQALCKNRMLELKEFLMASPQELTEYDGNMVRKYLKQITVYDDYYKVEFKSGISIDVTK